MKSFEELPLTEPVRRAVKELGFETPSPIQAQTLPILLKKPTDFIGLAATGTGKTAAFAIPLIEQLDPKLRATQFLIMCPTRELALQVAGQLNLIGKYRGVRALPVYGGADYTKQIRGLSEGVPIVVGTPGRLMDHLDRGNLKLDKIKTIVLDEADEMISMGFKEDLEKLLKSVKRDSSNIWLFSALMSREVHRVAKTYLKDPQQVQINTKDVLSATVEQFYFNTRDSDKPDVLCKVIENADNFYGLIFCQTKRLVSDLTTFLTNRGYRVDCLHGDKTQQAREQTMLAFRNKKVRMLICTDVASRGLDVKDVTHVINYSIPRELESYVHRIGRTARSGKAGIAISLVNPGNRRLIPRIEHMTNSRMMPGKLPTHDELAAKKFSRVLAKFCSQTKHERAMLLLGEDWKKAIAKMSPEEIVGRFVAMTSPELFQEKTREKTALGLPDRQQQPDRGRERNSRFNRFGGGRRGSGFQRGGDRRGPGFQRGGDRRGPGFAHGGDRRRSARPVDTERTERPSQGSHARFEGSGEKPKAANHRGFSQGPKKERPRGKFKSQGNKPGSKFAGGKFKTYRNKPGSKFTSVRYISAPQSKPASSRKPSSQTSH